MLCSGNLRIPWYSWKTPGLKVKVGCPEAPPVISAQPFLEISVYRIIFSIQKIFMLSIQISLIIPPVLIRITPTYVVWTTNLLGTL